MKEALALAEKGRYTASPNPMVGCLIVKEGHVIGRGYHERAGGPHAEVFALREAGVQAKGATVYVTLEPCCHFGKTPPCTDALIQAGVREVYLAIKDPFLAVNGKGIAALKAAGITVKTGLLRTQAMRLNEAFLHYAKHNRPWVIAKWAMSLDGKTTTHPLDVRHISSEEARLQTHALRQSVDAILIGADTAINDNPLLTVRLPQEEKIIKQPIRVVITARGRLPLDLKLFDHTLPSETIIATTENSSPDWRSALIKKNITVWVLPMNNDGQVDLRALLNKLGENQITSLLVEGGMTLHRSFFNENLVNNIFVYLSPLIIGDLRTKKYLKKYKLSCVGKDIQLSAKMVETDHV
jgi:diaminohydroxyphosphoribosylaminopyrimidine deaminase/5-amino-6-(5-phosphoribosylamino)uracil reductase